MQYAYTLNESYKLSQPNTVYMNLAGADPKGTCPSLISGRKSKLHRLKLKGYKLYKQAKLGAEAKDSSFV